MKINFEPILRRSFEITKTYKWLLVYGLIVAGSGGGAGFNGFSFSGSDSENMDPASIEGIKTKTTQVLGEKTSYLTDWLASVSPLAWTVLILTFIILASLAVVVSLIITNWARAGLIQGIDMALQSQESVTLKSTSAKAIGSIKNLIILAFINLGFVIAFIILLPLVGFLVYMLVKELAFLKILWIIIASVSGTIIFILGVIIISMIGVYAERLITLHGLSPFSAWKKGLTLSRANFLPTLLMGLLNMIISTLIGCFSIIIMLIVLGIPTILLLLPYIRSSTLPNIYVFVVIGVFILIFIVFNMIIRAGIAVFKYANWNQLFDIVLQHSKEKQNNE